MKVDRKGLKVTLARLKGRTGEGKEGEGKEGGKGRTTAIPNFLGPAWG